MTLRRFQAVSLVILITFCVTGSASPAPTRPFDEFGDINCEDEMARLDNFAVQLQSDPHSTGLILVYGGRRFRGRLPKRGESLARAARLRSYMVDRRGIPGNRIVMTDAGYTEEWHVELWNVPPGASMPEREPTIPTNHIKFRKGKPNPRDYQCRI